MLKVFLFIFLFASIAFANLDLNKVSKDLPLFFKKDTNVFIFLSSRCPCTARVLGSLRQLDKNYGDGGDVGLYFFNEGDGERRTELFDKKIGLKHSIIADEKHKFADIIGAEVTPEVWIVGREGNIIYRGAVVSENLQNFYLKDALEAIGKKQKLPFEYKEPLGCAIRDAFIESP